jgi:hypothetical protein
VAENRTLQIDQYGRLEAVVSVTRDGAAFPLVGYTAKMQIRANKLASDILAEYTTASGDITISGSAGQVIIDVTGAKTATLAITSGVYDLYVIDPSSNPKRVMEGNVLVSPSVTRPVP